jgi:hypothetical protein
MLRPMTTRCPTGLRAATAAITLVLLQTAPGAAEAPEPMPRPAGSEAGATEPAVTMPDPQAEADLFAMPRIAEELRFALGRLQGGDLVGATRILDDLIHRHPNIGPLHANRAALAVLAGETGTALEALEEAARHGTPELPALLADPLFAPLAADPATARQLAALAEAPEPLSPSPALVVDGVAEVAGANTVWNPATERLEPRFVLPGQPLSDAVLPPGPKHNARDLLREHWRRGRAAGNHGDLYDNRDRGHSTLDLAGFPQVTRIVYADAAQAAEADFGLNDRLLFDRVTFGNSSTALTSGPHWRSLPRHALTRPDGTGPMRLWQNWSANHLYVYPAHQDYGREAGDLFPANTPYAIVSIGSSGSDRPFLEAIAMTLASFRPATKARLIEERMVVPTVQFVFRRSLQNVRSREAYFSNAAHPAAFDARFINLARMVSLAQSIEPGAIPAEVRFAVLEEDTAREGVDFFGVGLGEHLFDTPSAIARIWRSKSGQRSMRISAEASRDVNGRPLTFHWRLLQGDPSRVTIEPEGDGSRARITIGWHDRFAVSQDDPQPTARVDIGVFANNGVHDSAPAILSWYFPPHETREYEAGPDGTPRIVAIDHADPAKAEVYADPLLLPRADWRDVYVYDEHGTLTGWTRHRGSRTDSYDAEGRRRLGDDRTEAVLYTLTRRPDGTAAVEELSADHLTD